MLGLIIITFNNEIMRLPLILNDSLIPVERTCASCQSSQELRTRSTGCTRYVPIARIATNQMKWRTEVMLDRSAKGEIGRDIVYINQLVWPAIITVIGAAITVERTITQFVRPTITHPPVTTICWRVSLRRLAYCPCSQSQSYVSNYYLPRRGA